MTTALPHLHDPHLDFQPQGLNMTQNTLLPEVVSKGFSTAVTDMQHSQENFAHAGGYV